MGEETETMEQKIERLLEMAAESNRLAKESEERNKQEREDDLARHKERLAFADTKQDERWQLQVAYWEAAADHGERQSKALESIAQSLKHGIITREGR